MVVPPDMSKGRGITLTQPAPQIACLPDVHILLGLQPLNTEQDPQLDTPKCPTKCPICC